MGDITKDKQELINWINQLEDEAVLQNLMGLKKESEGIDWWNEISNAEKAGIKRGQKQLDEGKGIPHEQVREKINDRFFQDQKRNE